MKILFAWLLVAPALALAQAPPANPADAGTAEAPGAEAKAPAAARSETEGPAVAGAKLGTGVKDREPEGVADSFSADVGKVYCWTKVTGAAGSEVTHAWYKGEQKMAEVKLAIPYPSTRTWSYKTIPPDGKGDWHVDVVAADGKVLASLPFKIE